MRSDTAARVVAPDGLIVGRYRLLGPLGAGASATVWAAVDETLGRQVALKLLSGPTAFDDADRDQLRTEARALASLAHPRIIVVFDYLEAPGLDRSVQPVLVTELLEGRDLAARLEEGPLPWPTALGVCGQLAEALAAAHAAGIVHRDVAPANVMLTVGGVKLLDFGIAQGPADRRDPDAMAVGTPVTMAPEQLRGHPALPASDMYALGCTLYWCLTGRPPFPNKDVAGLGAAHLRKAPPPLGINGLPVGVESFYLACLAKNPAARPTAQQAAGLLAPYTRTISGGSAPQAAAAPAPGPAGGEDATQLLPAVTDPGDGAAVGFAAAVPAADDAAADDPTAITQFVPGHGVTSHAGRRRPTDRRKVLPGVLVVVALAAVIAVLVGLAHAIGGGDGAAAPSLSGSAGASQAASNASTPADSATPTGTDGATPSASASASPTVSAPTPANSKANPFAQAFPDPATDPSGYLQALSQQVRGFVAQGPRTLQSGAGQDLLNGIGTVQNSVASAQQSRGRKQWRTVQSQIANLEQLVSNDAAAGAASQAVANALTGELQQLAANLPTLG
ncbi:serine/threonine protein kinase [Actinocrinis puniceicyclus]|uniref:non-specific serine/threonine protein kinase n=1 Tax=Actinocrinis puniceicyclus TaxID=977794 RepID=A0A8J7WUV3_9ACTN|nr:serine/threonine-protein kinase [Actinocrinis puniceicyclus]MBS2966225.1 serine/threonine protein kinase [Actinocrinis puniceicyclus]